MHIVQNLPSLDKILIFLVQYTFVIQTTNIFKIIMSERPAQLEGKGILKKPTPQQRIIEIEQVAEKLNLPVVGVKFTKDGAKTFAGSNNPLDLGLGLGKKSQLTTNTSKEQGRKTGKRKH